MHTTTCFGPGRQRRSDVSLTNSWPTQQWPPPLQAGHISRQASVLFESMAAEVALVNENECTPVNISESTATSATLRSRSLLELLETSHQGSAWSGEGGGGCKMLCFSFSSEV